MRRLVLCLLAVSLLLGGCTMQVSVAPMPSLMPAAAAPSPTPSPSPTPEPTPEPTPDVSEIGSGEFSDAGNLTPEQQAIILRYMDCYYDSLALLEVRDIDSLFAADASFDLETNRIVWEYVIELRSAQRSDLRLAAYSYSLECTETGKGSGGVSVRVVENSTQNFAATPDADTEVYDITHLFTLVEENGEWLIASHRQMDSTYWSVLGYYGFSGTFERGGTHESELTSDDGSDAAAATEAELLDYFRSRSDSRLAAHAEAAAERIAETDTLEPKAYTDEYDRAAAAAYALEWTHTRSGDWLDYTDSGGNCQNYVSQCLYAGGIPMDTQLPGLWKWYGDTPNNTTSRRGRSAAWTGVSYFRDYAGANEGYGLVATLDAPYFSGEAGDVLQTGNEEDEWRHVVIITEVITDGDGNVIDYLLCSNTTDIKNFPASIYPYMYQTLTKIHGWNS